jgi:hypothetical protein
MTWPQAERSPERPKPATERLDIQQRMRSMWR